MPAAKPNTIHAHFAPRIGEVSGSRDPLRHLQETSGLSLNAGRNRIRDPRKLTGMLEPSSPWIADLQQSQLTFLSRTLANFPDCIPLPWPPCPFSLHICIGRNRGPSRCRVKEIPRASCLGFGYLPGVFLVRHGI
jgi:hypothetical protein